MKIIRNDIVSKTGAVQWHLENKGKFYIASAVEVMFSGPEVQIFPADSEGKVTDFCEVYEQRGTLDHQQVIDAWLASA